MAANQPLDEIQWSAPYLTGVMGGIHENSVLHYFAESPFFDRTSNNATITTQAMINPQMAPIIETREAFEAHLRNIPGLEYVVAYGPKDFGGEAPIGEGLFVIRKQERRKRPGMADEIKVLATYYVVGNKIMMAPSVADILSSRVTSITLAMRNFMRTASQLPSYSPASGYSYLPSRSELADSLNRAASRAVSRATTPLRGDPEGFTDAHTGVATGTDVQSLVESFSTFLRYGDEYIDENPLVGEPRNFTFASSKQHVSAQREAAQKEEQARKDKEAESKKTNSQQQPQQSTAESPLSPTEGTQKKAGKTPASATTKKLKRKQSKAPNSPSSPQTPFAAESPS